MTSDATKMFQVRMPQALGQRLSMFADEVGLSKSGVIRAALDDHLRERGY